MKYICTLFLTLLSLTNAYAQNWLDLQKPEIIKNGTGYSTHDQAYGIFEDASGNLYQTGYYEGEITFGTSTLSSLGSRDIFVAKVNKNGGWDWAVSAGGTSTDFSKDLTCDASGNIYVTGYFYGTCYFGNQSVTAVGNSDVFIAKLSSSGEWLWVRAGLGSGFNRGNSVVCDNSGYCYVGGSFESTISFGNLNLSSSGLRDIFVAKISPAGNWIWAVKAGGGGQEEALGLKYNTSNYFLGVTGYYSSNPTFGQTVLTGMGGRDIFVARLDTNGSWNWAKSAASSGAEESRSIALDGAGNAVITGFYTTSVSFGGIVLQAATGKDVYVAKIDKSGNWIWAVNATGTGDQEAQAIGLDNGGNAYLTGLFYTEIKFANIELTALADRNLFVARISSSGSWNWGKTATGNSSIDGMGISVSSNGTSFLSGSFYDNAIFATTTLNTHGESDLFTARISGSGTWAWASSNGAVTGLVTGEGVCIDSTGNSIFTGSFYGTIRFGSDTLVSNGSGDIYIAKLSSDGNWIWAKSYGGSGFDSGKSVASDTNNNIYLTGSFENDVDFGVNTFNSNGFNDSFVMKISSSGVPVWVNTNGDNESDAGEKVVFRNNYIIYSGIFGRKPYFGITRLSARGNDDIFISKLDTSGNYIWAVSAGSNQFDAVNDIVLDKDENILATGGFEGTCYFGTKTISSSGGDDIFIAKMNSSGTWLWAVKAGTSNYQEAGWGVGTDSEKNIFVTGTYRALCLFGSQYLVNNGQNDISLSKLDSNGNWLWSKGIGGSGTDIAYDLDYLNGRITIAGAVSNGFTYNNLQFTANGFPRNAFISAFDSQGNILWVKSDEFAGFSEILSLSVSKLNVSHLTGNFGPSVKFGNLTAAEVSTVDRNAFIALNGVTIAKPDWTFRDSTGLSAVIKIPKNINPKVNGRDFFTGDAVGIFFIRNSNYYCAGMGYWTGDDMEITVWGDDINTPTKDGMSNSEKFNIRLWDGSKAEEIGCKVRYESGPDNFTADGFSVIKQLPIVYDTLKINLTLGWNMVSSYSMPQQPLMDSVFYDIKSKISLVKSSSGKTYIPQFNINTIGNWNIKEGYQIYATQNTELIILGDFVIPQDITYSFNSGWSLISYIRKTPMNAVTAFAPLVNQNKLVLVKNGSGKTYIPQFGINTIGNLVPGQAYQIYLNAGATFTYPAND